MATKYSINQAGAIVRDDGTIIPVDPNSADYLAFLQWQGAGNQVTVIVDSLADVAQRLAADVDATVAAIYSQWMRFAQEYLLRAAAAQAFKDANYVGDPGIWVNGFAVPAGLTNKQATDAILSQSVMLNGALSALGALRMRKYEILRATDKASAQAAHDDILTKIAAIAATLS